MVMAGSVAGQSQLWVCIINACQQQAYFVSFVSWLCCNNMRMMTVTSNSLYVSLYLPCRKQHNKTARPKITLQISYKKSNDRESERERVVQHKLSVDEMDPHFSSTSEHKLLTSVLWQCWLGGRKGCKKLSGGVLAWLSAWSEVQTCIWPSWCHCHSLSLASIKSRLVLLFWVVPDKGPLNGVCVFEYKFYLLTYGVVSVISSPGACILCCVQASYNRSSIVRVEAFVGINCSITSATTYVWRLLNATTHKPLLLAHLNLTQHVFHDPDLFIPPRNLPYGRYVVELRVCAPHWTASSLQEKSLWNFVEPKLSGKMQNALLVISHLYACIVFQTSPPSIDVLHLLLCGSFLLLSVTILRD